MSMSFVTVAARRSRLCLVVALLVVLVLVLEQAGRDRPQQPPPVAPDVSPTGTRAPWVPSARESGGHTQVVLRNRSGRAVAYQLCQERVQATPSDGVEAVTPQQEPLLVPAHGMRWGVVRDEWGPPRRSRWSEEQPIPWEVFAQGEYIGPARTAHVPEYRLRVDDQLEFIYRLTRLESPTPYELNVGDQVRIESSIDPTLNRDLIVQPDGTITVLLLGQIRAARRTVEELREALEEQYKKYYNVPAITVTPLQVNTKLNDLRNAVDRRFGSGGQVQEVRISPDGTIQLPAVGSVPAQGLTLGELKREIDERYASVVKGIEVMPRLVARAPRYVFVLGEVVSPGRYTLESPTTAMQAIAMAGGWKFGGNLHRIIIFRRTPDWRLVATRLDLNAALLGREPTPADEVWLRDNDILMIPKSGLLLMDDYIDLVFTRGLYGIVPAQFSFNFAKLSSL